MNYAETFLDCNPESAFGSMFLSHFVSCQLEYFEAGYSMYIYVSNERLAGVSVHEELVESFCMAMVTM